MGSQMVQPGQVLRRNGAVEGVEETILLLSDTQEQALAKFKAGHVTLEALQEWLADREKAVVAKAKAESQQPLSCKVAASGAVSVYGFQRMPITLYAEQWERMEGFLPKLKAFIAENDVHLAKKGRAPVKPLDNYEPDAKKRKENYENSRKS